MEKSLRNGELISIQIYYCLLEYKDENPYEFYEQTKKLSVYDLTKKEAIKLYNNSCPK